MHSPYKFFPVISVVMLASALQVAWAQSVAITFDASEAGGSRWQYIYDVANTSLPEPIQEFTIWFDVDLYANLSIVTPNPPAADWDELIAQPDPVLTDDGFYDAAALAGGIPNGGNVTGFCVEFDWLGIGRPGSQTFDIIDPDTYQTIYSGTTAPEPGTLALFALAAALSAKRSRYSLLR